jgi:CBS domain-containing protein
MDFATLLAKHASTGTRHTYVIDGSGRLVGVITSLDMLRKMVPSYLTSTLASSISDGAELVLKRFEENKRLLAADVMQPDFMTLSPDDTMIEANVRFNESKYNAIPVVDEAGILVGDVGRKDILRHIAVDICGLSGTV